MKPMKVLHVSKAFFPLMGGIEQVVYQIASGLKQSVNFIVLTTRNSKGKPYEIMDGITIRRTLAICELFSMPIALLYPFWFWYYARKVDVVDYHYPFPMIDFLVSIYFPKKTKLVVHWHSEIVAQKKIAKFLQPFFHRTLKKADKIIVATPIHLKESKLLQPFVDKCEVIPFGINVDFWQHKTAQEKTQIAHIVDEHGQFILAIGRLVPYKGFEVLLRALKPGMKLIIIGTGVLEEKLKNLSQALQLTQQVIFLGSQSSAQLKNYLNACYLLAFPSVTTNEAFGMVQLEAMACAKPIVNTLLDSAVPWVARNEIEALSVKPNDVIALSQALQHLLQDKALAKQLGENGLKRVRDLFSQTVFCEKTFQIYQQAVHCGE